MPGRRVRTTAQRPWIDWAYARSDRFPPRGVTPLTPIMGRATDPGENHDPGKGQFYTQLDPGAPIRERPRWNTAVRSGANGPEALLLEFLLADLSKPD